MADLIIVIDLVDVICAGVMARIVLNKVDYAVFECPSVLVIGLIAIIFVISSIVYKVISDEMVMSDCVILITNKFVELL